MLWLKLRYGVLRLVFPGQVCIASPALWERVRLLWVFRNFRSLSDRVLSARQQKLIDRLYVRSTPLAQDAGLPAWKSPLIGTLELSVLAPKKPSASVLDPQLTVSPAAVAQSAVLARALPPQLFPIPSALARVPRSLASVGAAMKARKERSSPAHFSTTGATALQTRPSDNVSIRRLRIVSRGHPKSAKFELLRGVAFVAPVGALAIAALFLFFSRPTDSPVISQPQASSVAKALSVPALVPTSTPDPPPTAAEAESQKQEEKPVRVSQSQPPRLVLPARRAPALPIQAASTMSPTAAEPSLVANPSSLSPDRVIYPRYPAAAWFAGKRGEVVVRIQVTSEGRVIDASVLSGDSVLSAAALEVVRKWRFSSVNVPTAATVRFRFINPDAISVRFDQ